MKLVRFLSVLIIGLALAMGAAGCKKKPQNVTMIPGVDGQGGVAGDNRQAPPELGDSGVKAPDTAAKPTGTELPKETGTGIAGAPLEEFEGMLADREAFKADTVYFDFDRSTVPPAEKSKVQTVASALKAASTNKLLIEGHCDDRGTEEYNRALGERRALALREQLAAMGIGPERIRTLSYGKDKPAVMGNDESAWSKNRRGEFILLKPKQ